MAEYIDRNLIEWYGCDFENDSCKNRECSSCSYAECSHSQVMQIPTANVIPIPEGATNGDIIKAMFPDIEVKPVNFDGVIGYDVWKLDVTCTCETYFTKGLWDAPYKYRKVEE